MLDTASKQLIRNVKEFLTHWGWGEVTVGENGLSIKGMREVMMSTWWTVTSLWTLPSARKKFVLLNEFYLRKYVMGTFGLENERYRGQALDESHIKRLGKPTETH